VARIAPLGLASTNRRIHYLRTVLAYLGLRPSEHGRPSEIADVLAASVFFRGRTLENALVRAADGYLIWGDAARAVSMLRLAARESRPKPSVLMSYFHQLPKLAHQRLEMGDAAAAERYAEGARLFVADHQLTPYIDAALRTELQEFGQGRLEALP